jgi:hypothetical protein
VSAPNAAAVKVEKVHQAKVIRGEIHPDVPHKPINILLATLSSFRNSSRYGKIPLFVKGCLRKIQNNYYFLHSMPLAVTNCFNALTLSAGH